MEKLEKIIKYLDGDLIYEEKLQLEAEVSCNADLKQKLNTVAEINAIISDYEMVSFVSNLNKLKKHRNQNKIVLLTNSWISNKKILVAASISILLLISFLLVFHSKPNNDNLFSQYYTRYDASLITRGESDVDDLTVAIQLYDRKKYVEAISKFSQLIKLNNQNTAAHFFIGISYMETNTFDKAIENLNTVIAQKDSAFIEHAEWYLALCFLKINKLHNAKTIINQIASGNSFYQPKALELLHKL